MKLQYDSVCRDCGAHLPKGTEARLYKTPRGSWIAYGRGGCHDRAGTRSPDWPTPEELEAQSADQEPVPNDDAQGAPGFDDFMKTLQTVTVVASGPVDDDPRERAKQLAQSTPKGTRR